MQAVNIRVAPGELAFQVTRGFADRAAHVAHFLVHPGFAGTGVVQRLALAQKSAMRLELFVLGQGIGHDAREAAVGSRRVRGRGKGVSNGTNDALVAFRADGDIRMVCRHSRFGPCGQSNHCGGKG